MVRLGMGRLLRTYACSGGFLAPVVATELIALYNYSINIESRVRFYPDFLRTLLQQVPRSDMHMPMLYCGFLPRYGHQPRSTFLHLVEMSDRPPTAPILHRGPGPANGPELIGYKVPQQAGMSTYFLHAMLLLRAAIRQGQTPGG